MRVTVLSSGSGGNCTLIEGAGLRVLVDAGLPLRAVKARMAAAGVPLEEVPITDLLITHEHSDHGGCAGVLGRKLGLTVRRGSPASTNTRRPTPSIRVQFPPLPLDKTVTRIARSALADGSDIGRSPLPPRPSGRRSGGALPIFLRTRARPVLETAARIAARITWPV